MLDLFAVNERPIFSFLGDEVVLGKQALRELRDWEWSSRLAGIGMQRLEFDSSIPISLEELDALLDEIVARLTPRPTASSAARQERVTGIRFGAVGVGDEVAPEGAPEEDSEKEEVVTATYVYSLEEEAAAVVWVHDVLRDGGELPLMEAEAVVRSLTGRHARRSADDAPVITAPPIRRVHDDTFLERQRPEYGTCRMAGSRRGGMSAWYGVAGLLHDLGKVTIPKEILNKPGTFDDREREIMNSHPVEGARMILTSDQQLDLAAAVAYGAPHHDRRWRVSVVAVSS